MEHSVSPKIGDILILIIFKDYPPENIELGCEVSVIANVTENYVNVRYGTFDIEDLNVEHPVAYPLLLKSLQTWSIV